MDFHDDVNDQGGWVGVGNKISSGLYKTDGLRPSCHRSNLPGRRTLDLQGETCLAYIALHLNVISHE